MKLIIFLCGFFGTLILQWLVIKGMENQIDQTSHKNLDFILSSHGLQLRILNFILAYFFAVVVGAVSVYIFYMG
jgi:uncharacterized membrane protein YjgN (DUF898 family)